jgi:hypothetical protein
MNWRKEKNVLILDTGNRIEFIYPIKGLNNSSGLTCLDVKLDVPIEQLGIENYYCISKTNGDILSKYVSYHSIVPECPDDMNRAVPEKCTLDWAKEGEVLIIDNERQVRFGYPIGSVFETCGVLIVVLDIPPKESMTENVFAVSKEGKILWQIERTPKTASCPVNNYTSVDDTSEPGIAVAFNWNCTNVYIDLNTGKVLDTKFTK